MAIATKPAIADCAHGHTLPQSWRTLYELTKLDDEQIVAGIKAGEITADMTRAEACALRVEPSVQVDQPPHEEMADAVEQAVARFIGRLNSPQQFVYVRRRLERLLEFLTEEENEHGIGRSRKTSARPGVD
jgi:hypothetical protein